MPRAAGATIASPRSPRSHRGPRDRTEPAKEAAISAALAWVRPAEVYLLVLFVHDMKPITRKSINEKTRTSRRTHGPSRPSQPHAAAVGRMRCVSEEPSVDSWLHSGGSSRLAPAKKHIDGIE